MSDTVSASDVDFDIYDQTMADNRHEVFDELRGKCPVLHSTQTEEDGFYVVTSFDANKKAAHNTSVFSSRFATLPRYLFGEGNETRAPVTLDPPIHQRYRRALQPNFGPKAIEPWTPSVRKIAREAIAKLIDDGRCEAKSQYTMEISSGMMAALFGVPDEDRTEFKHWLHEIVGSGDMERGVRASEELYGYLGRAVESRRSSDSASDDLITKIMTSDFGPEELPEHELVGMLVMIAIAALDTVASTLGSILVHLAQNPSDRERLVAEPELIPTAIEEFVRYYAAVVSARESNEDAELAGVDIPAESMVLLCWNAANRDPDAFEQADQCVIDRQKNPHIGFGIGPHRCLGIAVARLELKVGLEEWLAAIPEFELDGEVPGANLGMVCGPLTVPLKFPAGDARAA